MQEKGIMSICNFMNKMIIEIKNLKPKKDLEDKKINELIIHFNEESERHKSRFKIFLENKKYPYLISERILSYNKYSMILPIIYEDYFIFDKGLDEELFNKIKPILENIPEKFKIRII